MYAEVLQAISKCTMEGFTQVLRQASDQDAVEATSHDHPTEQLVHQEQDSQAIEHAVGVSSPLHEKVIVENSDDIIMELSSDPWENGYLASADEAMK